MTECENCKYALWDYEEYYGTAQKEWFISGCRRGVDYTENCEYYDEKKKQRVTL